MASPVFRSLLLQGIVRCHSHDITSARSCCRCNCNPRSSRALQFRSCLAPWQSVSQDFHFAVQDRILHTQAPLRPHCFVLQWCQYPMKERVVHLPFEEDCKKGASLRLPCQRKQVEGVFLLPITFRLLPTVFAFFLAPIAKAWAASEAQTSEPQPAANAARLGLRSPTPQAWPDHLETCFARSH